MGNRRELIFLLALLGTAAAACSNEKAANESNFSAAINAYLGDRQECLNAASYPKDMISEFQTGDHDALTQAGLLNREELKRPREPYETVYSPDGLVRFYRYTLTERGRAALSDRGWCYGTKKLLRIVRFTEPADALGQRMSEVTYTYSYVGAPDWVKNKAVVEAFPQLRGAGADPPPQARVVLVLTNRGWEPAH